MEAATYQTPAARTKLTLQRGNFYFGMGIALLVGLAAIVGMGLLGVTSLGVFSTTTAMAMIGLSIALLSVVAFALAVTLRRTLGLLSHHESALAEQADRHADLASKVQAQWRAEQVLRDRGQDAEMASLAVRQDAVYATGAVRGLADARRPAAPIADPFEGGQVHPVIEVEGIGEHYSKLLQGIQLHDTRKLWNADPTYVAGALKITPTVVSSWQSMAELMAVTGIGKQYAELLVRADVNSIDELCAETAQALLNRIHRLEKHQGNRIQGNTIGLKAAQNWIAAAQAHHGVAPPAAGAGGPGA